MVPPTIITPLNSNRPAIGEFLTLNCTATGNPKPKVSFYKNGVPLQFDFIVTYNEPVVKINTYEEEHKGIYQCVANNSAGEVHSAALFSWINKRIPKRPEKVKCYPLNHSTILIDYQSSNEVNFYIQRSHIVEPKQRKTFFFPQWNDILYYTSRNYSSNIKWKSSAEYNLQKLDGKSIVPILNVDLFDPFMFYVRGLVKIGHEQRIGGNQKLLYDMSRLSKGIKCALQGCESFGNFWLHKTKILFSFHFTVEIYSIVHQTGIFIWWPKLYITNVRHLNIQFRYNDTANLTKFSDQIIGTEEKLNEVERWDDIQPKLIKISATTNVYPEFNGSRRKRLVLNNATPFSASGEQPLNDDLKVYDTAKTLKKSEGITEVRVRGHVTGILIPNTQSIDVRVLVPVMDGDDELDQDNTYVEWKTVSV